MSWKLMPILPPQRGIGFELKIFERLEAELAHPGRLVLHLRDLADDLRIDSLAGLEHVLRLGCENRIY